MKTGGEPRYHHRQPAMTATIATVLNIPADRARLVEGYIRSEVRTINQLSKAKIRSMYRWIGPTVDADPEMADRLAASYGL